VSEPAGAYAEAVTVAEDRRRVDRLVRRCYAGLDAASLRDEVLRGLRSVITIDAAFFATVDPATILFTSVLAEEPLREATSLFLDNEFGHDDVNKFAMLAFASDPVNSLDLATEGDRRLSARYTDVMAPLALGDELRAALVSRGCCWGVLCLHRGASATGFSARDVALLRRLVPHVAEGLRRAVVMVAMTTPARSRRGPGVVVLDADMAITSMNPDAERWLAELPDGGSRWLPATVRAAALRVEHTGVVSEQPSLPTRVRCTSGEWLAVHASPLGDPAAGRTVVVLESARPVEVASLLLDAHGLTPAQSRVAALVLQGRSTRQIVNELHISSYTVQEHLRAAFDRFGVASRRELVATLLGQSH
jgi:DNA-binding CsgD family transcriptional regulator